MKTLALIQARITSSRLPGKVLLPLPFPNGIPLISLLYNKLKKLKAIDTIAFAIPSGLTQYPLKKFLIKNKYEYIEGSEEDVLSRFAAAIETFSPDNVIRITADNPFIDIDKLKRCIDIHEKKSVDYTVSNGLPYGMNMEIIRSGTLLKLNSSPEINLTDREHVTSGLRKIKGITIQSIRFQKTDYSKLRVTVDTLEDYMRAALLTDLQLKSEHIGDFDFIKKVYKRYPFIFN